MKSASWNCKLSVCAALATMLVLTSSCASFTSASRPSVLHAASGNAFLLTLPAGAVILFPTQQSQQQVRAVAVNETLGDGDRTVTLTAPLKLVSPAYLAARDARELQLTQLVIGGTLPPAMRSCKREQGFNGEKPAGAEPLPVGNPENRQE